MESDGHGGEDASASRCPRRLPKLDLELPLKSPTAPALPRHHPCKVALPDASGGNSQRSKLPNISNTRRPAHPLTNSPRYATSGKSESFPARPFPAPARNNWRDPKISSPPESSRVDWITSVQSLPIPAADICARNLQPDSSRKNRIGHTSHQGSV